MYVIILLSKYQTIKGEAHVSHTQFVCKNKDKIPQEILSWSRIIVFFHSVSVLILFVYYRHVYLQVRH